MKRNIILMFLLYLLTISLFGENVNGYFQGELSLTEENTVSIAMEEVTSIVFDKETSFLEGIEIKIEVPRELQKYRNSFALYVYKNISPEPDSSARFYKGTRIFMRLLPVQNNIYIRIPAFEENAMAQSVDAILIPGFTSRGDYPLLATIIPIMKGIPGDVYNYKFNFTCKPIYSPKGSLTLNINSNLNDSGETFNVSIDNELVKWPSQEYILDEGLHELNITSSTGMSKSASVVINSSEKQSISLLFEYSEPEIKIEAPDAALIILDNVELIRKNSEDPIKVTAGEHIVIFDIDGYQFSREFVIEPGDSLIISLILDVLIHKN